VTNRYEIREEVTTNLQREMGFMDTVFEVWDIDEDRRVPFGTYADREAAARRIARMKERET
jgi:hypothetical protein